MGKFKRRHRRLYKKHTIPIQKGDHTVINVSDHPGAGHDHPATWFTPDMMATAAEMLEAGEARCYLCGDLIEPGDGGPVIGAGEVLLAHERCPPLTVSGRTRNDHP